MNEQRNEGEWNEEAFANLLDVSDNNTATVKVNEVEVKQEQEQPTENNSKDINKNVVATSELFDDPHTGKTQPTLASNPFAKFGTVGLGFGVVFVIAALSLNKIMTAPSRTAPDMAKTTPTPSMIAVEKEQPGVTQTGKYKAELALGEQADRIKAARVARDRRIASDDRSRTSKKESPNSNIKPNTGTPKPTPPTSIEPPRYYPRPRQHQLNLPERNFVNNNVGSRTPVERIKQVESTDPIKQWEQINRVGSYGSVAHSQNNKDLSKATNTPVPQNNNKSPIRQVGKISQPTTNTNNTSEVAVAPKATQLVFEQDIANNNVAKQEQDIQPDPTLEQNILKGIPIRQLRVGMVALGKTMSPMVWANSLSDKTVEQGRTENNFVFVVRLTQPIVDDKGYEVIPTGSEIVGSVQNVHSSGASTVQATRLVVDGREYILPQSAIAITAKDGNPLIASRYGNKGGEIFNRDAKTFIFGSLANVGKVLNQPDESFSLNSIGIGGSTNSTSIKRKNANLLGAVLEGGFTPGQTHLN